MPWKRWRRCGRAGIRAELDLRNEKINYKVREHCLAKVPVMFVVGKREVAGGHRLAAPPRREGQPVLPLEAAIAELALEATPPDLRG